MYGFSTVDGFMAVNENLEDMINYLANEPSMGLYFVQQHAHSAMPNLLNLKDRVSRTTRETVLHTEDLEDSILAVRSMADCGVPIIDEMMKDINKSLHLMSTSAPQRGLIQGSRFGSSVQPLPSPSDMESGQSSKRGYFKSVFSATKRRASKITWPTVDPTSHDDDPEGARSSTHLQPVPVVEVPDSSGGELQVSLSETASHDSAPKSSPTDDTSVDLEHFHSIQEAKLKEWLQETEELSAGSIAK